MPSNCCHILSFLPLILGTSMQSYLSPHIKSYMYNVRSEFQELFYRNNEKQKNKKNSDGILIKVQTPIFSPLHYSYLLFHQVPLWNVKVEPMTSWSPLGTHYIVIRKFKPSFLTSPLLNRYILFHQVPLQNLGVEPMTSWSSLRNLTNTLHLRFEPQFSHLSIDIYDCVISAIMLNT